MTDDAQTQAAGRVREAAGSVQNLFGQAKDAARDAGKAAADYARGAYDQGGETLRDGTQAVAKRVQDNPLGALLLAGGIGFALGLLMTRPRRPPPRWRYYSRGASVAPNIARYARNFAAEGRNLPESVGIGAGALL